ncbi:RBBP9/YdeN family alpha/beta hydrolase [Gordonia liuliyuniae]|uniref:Alpha/beta hydrolase n=1 Tax=Gordonia liuliyuniae TaxID=2911517 RepID=A0ABS9IRC6_9ACTN|nr:alpha/beta hydrolase [Gordonia liuliyuniae]MCF8588072.1 alpha/beta hydrolase [Gordonia liuliyuniae]
MSGPTVVIVPGLRGIAPEHWQERYAARVSDAVTVPFPAVDDWHDLAARSDLIDDTVRSVNGSVILVAHSAGVLAVVHWARGRAAGQGPDGQDSAGGAVARVAGALLVTPPDFGVDWPQPHPRPAELSARGWEPISRRRLPFPSILAVSRDDPLARYRTGAGLAEVWGSRLVDLGDAGHLNPASGYGEWPMLEPLLTELSSRVVG